MVTFIYTIGIAAMTGCWALAIGVLPIVGIGRETLLIALPQA